MADGSSGVDWFINNNLGVDPVSIMILAMAFLVGAEVLNIQLHKRYKSSNKNNVTG